MKNKFLLKSVLSVFAVTGIFFSSCEKSDLQVFDKNFTGVYFQTDSIYYSFGVTPLSVQEYELQIPVTIMGAPTDADRTFKTQVIADKTTAQAGVHYDLANDFVIKKDSINGFFTMKIKRAELKSKDFKVFFALAEGNGFMPVNENFKSMVVQFTDKLAKPTFWPSQLGVWSETKHIKYIEIFRMMEQRAPETYGAIIGRFGVDMNKATAWPWDYNNSMIKYVLIPLYQYFVEQNPQLGITIPRPSGY